jgi:hypothetical protein
MECAHIGFGLFAAEAAPTKAGFRGWRVHHACFGCRFRPADAQKKAAGRSPPLNHIV